MASESNGKKVIYTEDKTLVFNLYLSKIPRAISESQVREYFTKFGNVLSVTINEKRFNNCNTHRYGFVNFETAESAAAALCCTHHMISNSHITIEPANSWKQPNIADTLTERLDTKSILMLNDDCLFHIFSFLSLKQQFMLSNLCDRFKNILEMIFRTKKALFVNREENLTLMEIRQICHSFGHLIQEVHSKYHDSCADTLNLIEHSCRELRWLEMKRVTIQKPFIRRLSKSFTHLTKVELESCGITDNDCFELSKLSKLEFLNLSYNFELTGKYLADFPKLVALNLWSCRNIQPKPFFELCSRNRNLISLDIYNCTNLNRENFYELAGQEHLEKLVISTCYSTDDLSPIANLKNLKELEIWSTGTAPQNSLFEELARKGSTSLVTLVMRDGILNETNKRFISQIKSIKTLGITFDEELDDEYLGELSAMPELTSLDMEGCPSISNQGLINLFSKPNKLEHVYIPCTRTINERALDPIVEKMKEAKRTTPCILDVGCTLISSSITETDKYKENSSLLQLSFTFSLTNFSTIFCPSSESSDNDDDNDELGNFYYDTEWHQFL